MVPSSTGIQLAIGDALAIASLKNNLANMIFHFIWRAWGNNLKLLRMLFWNNTFINENKNMKEATKIISKKLVVVIARNKNKITTGIITDGNIRKLRQKNTDFQKTSVKEVMTRDPITITSDTLAIKALRIMNEKKITSLCVIKNKNFNKTIGIIHIHHILETNVE